MKKYAKLIIALGLAGGIMLTGCQKNESGSAEPTATPEPTEAAEEVTPEPTAMAAEEPEPTKDPIPDGYVVSYLTGEYVPEAIGRTSPGCCYAQQPETCLPTGRYCQCRGSIRSTCGRWNHPSDGYL